MEMKFFFVLSMLAVSYESDVQESELGLCLALMGNSITMLIRTETPVLRPVTGCSCDCGNRQVHICAVEDTVRSDCVPKLPQRKWGGRIINADIPADAAPDGG